MSAPFTAGPWHFSVDDFDHGSGIVGWVTAPGGKPIADISAADVGVPEAQANAQLIALAPFMHMLLEDIAARCARLSGDLGPQTAELVHIHHACRGLLRIAPASRATDADERKEGTHG